MKVISKTDELGSKCEWTNW